MDDNRHPKGNILKQMVDSLGPWQIPLAICGPAALFFHSVSAKMKLQVRIQATECWVKNCIVGKNTARFLVSEVTGVPSQCCWDYAIEIIQLVITPLKSN